MTNPLVDELRSAADARQMNRVERFFGDQPDVLDAIVEAHAKGAGYRAIAEILQRHAPEGEKITRHSVEGWLQSRRA